MLPWPWQAWVREYFFQLENGSFNKNDIIFQCGLKSGSLFETRDFKNTMFWWDFMLLPTSPQSVAPVCWLFVTPDRCLEKEQHLGGFILGLKCYWWSRRRLKTWRILRFRIGIYRESTNTRISWNVFPRVLTSTFWGVLGRWQVLRPLVKLLARITPCSVWIWATMVSKVQARPSSTEMNGNIFHLHGQNGRCCIFGFLKKVFQQLGASIHYMTI